MRKIKLYKRYALGGNEYDPYVQQQIDSKGASSASMNSAGKGIADGAGSIPIIGAFKQVGEGISAGARQDDKYGVASSDSGAFVGGVFNPRQQTTDGFSDVQKGDYKGAALNFLAPPLAAVVKNQQMARDRDYALGVQATKRFQNEGEMKYQNALRNGFQAKGNEDAQKYMKNGGVLQLSKTNVAFNGNSHENGGIKQPVVNGKPLRGVEVEDKETMSTSNGQKFVFSDELGFAKLHKPLARSIGKIESKMKNNPNDPIAKRTLQNLKSREDQLKLKQELTKESMGIPNDSESLRNGGLALYPKGGAVYTAHNGQQFSKTPDYVNRFGHLTYPQDPVNKIVGTNPNGLVIREGELQDRLNTINPNRVEVLNQPGIVRTPMQMDSLHRKGMLAKGGLTKMGIGGFGLFNNNKYGQENNSYLAPGSGVLATQQDLDSRQSVNPYTYQSSLPVTSNFMGGTGSLQQQPVFSQPQTSSNTTGRKLNLNYGKVTKGLTGFAAYAGAFENNRLNELARTYETPKEALPDYVDYKPVDFTNQRIEADNQRRETNQILTNNLSNSNVLAAVKQKNLATTIRNKNLINQEESNINTQGINQTRLYNNQIQQRRNQIDVENRDRDYNKEMRYITEKGRNANNFSDIYQQQSRDNQLERLENRKIDTLSKYDSGRGVYGREISESAIKDKEERGQSLTAKEKEFKKKNPDKFASGGLLKSKLYKNLK